MHSHFDQIVPREQTYAFKWEKYKGRDILPMWVADTEFKCAQPILDALNERVNHGILGYTLPAEYTPAKDAIVRWLAQQHQWDVSPDWIVWTPGVVPAFNVACKTYCKPGDKVVVQVPNYPPLLAAPALNGLERADVATVLVDGRWTLDFDELESQLKDPKTSLFILCNPMNPVGSVLTEQELETIADMCLRYDVVLCSDEIHCDLILDEGKQHIPASKLDKLSQHSLTLMAASKTFNVAGLGASFAIIPDKGLRQQFMQAAMGIVPWVNILGLVATEVAFTQCDDWYQGQMDYLRHNRDYLVEEVNNISGLSLVSPDATFLAWIDASGLNTSDVQKAFEDAGVGPSPGRDFGWGSFARINFGCPKAHLVEAIKRLKSNL